MKIINEVYSKKLKNSKQLVKQPSINSKESKRNETNKNSNSENSQKSDKELVNLNKDSDEDEENKNCIAVHCIAGLGRYLKIKNNYFN